MERIRAELANVLKPTESRLQRRLSEEDGLALTALMESLMRRYPSQDQEESIEEYLGDFERLVLKYSLQTVRDAIEQVRISGDQHFFPRPDDIAAVIEAKSELSQYDFDKAAGVRRRAEQARVVEFLRTDPEEIAYRKRLFGYDPYEKRNQRA